MLPDHVRGAASRIAPNTPDSSPDASTSTGGAQTQHREWRGLIQQQYGTCRRFDPGPRPTTMTSLLARRPTTRRRRRSQCPKHLAFDPSRPEGPRCYRDIFRYAWQEPRRARPRTSRSTTAISRNTSQPSVSRRLAGDWRVVRRIGEGSRRRRPRVRHRWPDNLMQPASRWPIRSADSRAHDDGHSHGAIVPRSEKGRASAAPSGEFGSTYQANMRLKDPLRRPG